MDNEKRISKGKVIKFTILLAIILLGLLLYSRYISTSGLFIKEYKIETTKLDDNYDSFKIVHFTDLHYGTTVNKKELKRLVNKINDQKPDVIVFTGDLVDRKVKLSDKEYIDMSKELSKLDPKIEVISVIGNHDYYNDYYNKIVKDLSWISLDNTYEYVYNNSKKPIVFVGLDDLTNGKIDINNAFSFLNESEDDKYTIVLTHEPDTVLEFKDYSFDLVFSGHSHLGQVRLPGFGAVYTPVGSKKYYDEHYTINNSHLYISSGIGTSTIPFRFLNRPSFNLYRFYTK